MSESNADTSTQDGKESSESTSDAGDKFTPITSQDDLNRLISDRVARERSKYSDYKDIKAKAAKLDEIEAASKSETERAAERASAAEAERDVARAESLRLRIATKNGISDTDADLFLTGTDEDTLNKQAARLAQHASDRKKNGNVVPNEGASTTSKPDQMREFTRSLFGTGD